MKLDGSIGNYPLSTIDNLYALFKGCKYYLQ